MSRASDAIRWSRACRSAGSSTITNTSVKNRSTKGPNAGGLGEGLPVVVAGVEHVLDDRLPTRELGHQGELGGFGQEPRRGPPLGRSGSDPFVPKAMFFTRLNAVASCWNSGVPGELGQHFQHAARLERADLLQRPCRPARPARCARRSPAARGRASSRSARNAVSAARAAGVERPIAFGGRDERAHSGPHRQPRELGQIDQRAKQPVRLTPQAVGVARPGRPLARREQADQRVELVGHRHRGPGQRAGAQLRARRRRVGFDGHRQVVVVDRLPHRLGQAFLARVDAAHRALQLGELAHQVGAQVRLAQPPRHRRRRGFGGLSERLARQPTRPGARRARPWPCSCPASCGTGSCPAARCAIPAAPCDRRSRRTARRAAAP